MVEAETRAVSGRAARAARAVRRWPSRSPRLLPSATYAFSGSLRSDLDNEVTRDPLEIGSEVAELADGPLQLNLSGRGFSRPFCQRIGIGPALGRTGGNLLDLSGEGIHRIPLLCCSRSNGLGVAAGLASGTHDSIQCLGGIGAQLFDSGHNIPASLHLAGHGGYLIGDFAEQAAGFLGGVQALSGELPDLGRHDGKAPALPTGSRGFDRGVQGDEIGQIGNLTDGANETGDALSQGAEGSNPVGAPGDKPL